ncbi:MAG: DUF4925 domain-containing protein [Muribaculaceae bacterium]|nr:DUF4925 domain-containing protein [Muribaculaceae bacterium]
MADDGLAMTYNGAPLVGKTVTFTPNTNGTATVTLAGEPFDISELMGGISKAEETEPSLTIPSAGVLPGSKETVINVTLTGDSDNCTFEGTGDTDYCTYSYSGSVTAEKMNLNLTDVKLKNISLAGTWTLPELYQIDPFWGDEQPNIYNVARIVWQSEKMIELAPNFGMPIETILGMTLVMPMIGDGDGKVSPVEMLTMLLKNVTFHEDGNVTATYINAADMNQAPVTSPVGIAQYVITSEGNLRLFLNPTAIIMNTAKAIAKSKTRAIDMSLIVESMMQQLIPLLSQGIPVSYGKAIMDSEGQLNEDPNILSFYLGTETLLPLLKTFAPLLSDADFVNGIVEEAKKDPTMGSMAEMLPSIFNSLPGIIETTTKVEIGINLKK